MGIGGGIILIVIGAVLAFALDVNLPVFNSTVLGYILMGAGVVVIIIVLALQGQRTRASRSGQAPPSDPPIL